MMRQVLIVSHADADGHVIAEQVRRNLAAVPSFDVSVVVDPERTKDHRTWLHLEQLSEIDRCELVFFVDLMFAPASYYAEADALVAFVQARPDKRFFLLDHHPLPLRLLDRAPNLRSLYKPDVIDCTLGTPSWMMIIAALLESQASRAKKIKKPVHEILAKGVKRAAAPGGPLAGEKLLALLRFDRWQEIEELGLDDASFHRLPRGRRAQGGPESKVLKRLDRVATELLTRPPASADAERSPMSYDLESAEPLQLPQPAAANARDLETIVMLLELAAIYLTKGPESTFTAKQLIAEARKTGGGIELDENDIKIVLGKAGFLKKEVGGKFRLK